MRLLQAEIHPKSILAFPIDTDGETCLSPTLIGRCTPVYRNHHDLTFDDMAGQLGIGRVTRLVSGWGVKFLTMTNDGNDGNLDLLANGHPDDKIEPQRHARELS